MDRFMEMAIAEAREGIARGHGGPFGSVVVMDGAVIGRGHNEVIRRNDPTCHGEMMAIRDACATMGVFDLSGCDLYTTSEPCLMCLGAVMWANISRVFYGCTIEDAEGIGFRDQQFAEVLRYDTDRLSCSQLERGRCQELFAEYGGMKDRKRYRRPG